jgi:hypothetical protein
MRSREQKRSQTGLQAWTKALSRGHGELPWSACNIPPSGAHATPVVVGKTSIRTSTEWKPARNGYPTRKMYWDPAAAQEVIGTRAQCGGTTNSELHLQPFQRLDNI